MDPSNSSEHDDFRVIDLLKSEHHEDHETAKKAVHTFEAIVRDLLPILRYITQPRPAFRGPFKEAREGEGSSCTEQFAENVRPKEKRVVELLRQQKENALNSFVLFLNDRGIALAAHLCPREPVETSTHEHLIFMGSEENPAWQYFSFREVLTGMHDRLAEARAKREAHVRAIEKREERLNRVLEIYKHPKEKKG